ncbi:hypothetical protein ACHAW5_008345 [Stephanodiscus triporus]|uniref:Uncharacterized protein n=1 Tax=Stephanodiscus triporus TaxID=2934178 RepID=A0ABD3N788_9STRA
MEGDESRLGGGGNTGTSVPDRLVRDGELAQVHAHHLWLHLHPAEHLPVVNSHDRPDHLWNYDHVAEVGLDAAGLLARLGLLLRLAEALDEGHGLALQPAGHAPAGAGGDEVHQLVVGQVEEGVELDAAEGEFLESALLAKLGYLCFVHDCGLNISRHWGWGGEGGIDDNVE